MNINTNFGSLYTRNNIEKVVQELETNYQRLSSAKKLNAAKDDASGLAITESMNAMIRGNNKSIDNMSMVINLAKVADGGLASMNSMLQRVREIAIQANNGTYSPEDKAFLQLEADNLINEIEHIANNTYFNGISLLNTGRTVYDPTTTAAAGGVDDGTKIVDIAAGGYVDIPFIVPPKQEQEGSMLTLNLEKLDQLPDTITRTYSMSRPYSPSQSQVIHVPDGYQINTISLTSNSSGDLDGSGYVSEYLNVSINGTNVQTLGADYGGYNETDNLLNHLPGLVDDEQFTVGTYISPDVSSANVTVNFNVTYKLKGSILNAVSPLGESFGPNTAHLGGDLGPQWDYENNSTVGAIYTGGGDRIDEQLKFYNPKEGTWFARVYNPSTTQATRVKVEAEYRIADNIPVHTGYGADDREMYTLSNVTRETIGLENLDVSTQLGIQQISSALEVVSKERQKYGLLQSKFESLSNYRSSEVINVEAARSKITDADMAKEASNATKNKILYQSSITMLVTVNQAPSELGKVIQQLG